MTEWHLIRGRMSELKKHIEMNEINQVIDITRQQMRCLLNSIVFLRPILQKIDRQSLQT